MQIDRSIYDAISSVDVSDILVGATVCVSVQNMSVKRDLRKKLEQRLLDKHYVESQDVFKDTALPVVETEWKRVVGARI